MDRPTRGQLDEALCRLLAGAGPGEAEVLRAFILLAGRPDLPATTVADIVPLRPITDDVTLGMLNVGGGENPTQGVWK